MGEAAEIRKTSRSSQEEVGSYDRNVEGCEEPKVIVGELRKPRVNVCG